MDQNNLVESIAVIPENYDEIIKRTKDHENPFTQEELQRINAKAKTVPNGGVAYVYIMDMNSWGGRNGDE